MKYDAHSDLARAIARELGFKQDVGFIAALQRGERVYVTVTAVKPDELVTFCQRARAAGFIAGPEVRWGANLYAPKFFVRAA